ncbi:MAG TPA: hypothetical protein VMH78_04360 [Thermoplasmata archaeon]|nr:hypothetical protein [Thermoplasmata archaeon]
MVCRWDTDDPGRCDRCGESLWVAEDGLFCGECGVTMPCSMRLLPIPLPAPDRPPGTAVRARAEPT